MGERLLKARKAAGKTQLEVATALGVAESTYCCYEKGTRQPNPVKLAKLAAIFGVSGHYLLGLTNDPTPISTEIQKEDEKETKLLACWRSMTDEQKSAILIVAEAFVK